jgi:hypothetical protein
MSLPCPSRCNGDRLNSIEIRFFVQLTLLEKYQGSLHIWLLSRDSELGNESLGQGMLGGDIRTGLEVLITLLFVRHYRPLFDLTRLNRKSDEVTQLLWEIRGVKDRYNNRNDLQVTGHLLPGIRHASSNAFTETVTMGNTMKKVKQLKLVVSWSFCTHI